MRHARSVEHGAVGVDHDDHALDIGDAAGIPDGRGGGLGDLRGLRQMRSTPRVRVPLTGTRTRLSRGVNPTWWGSEASRGSAAGGAICVVMLRCSRRGRCPGAVSTAVGWRIVPVDQSPD